MSVGPTSGPYQRPSVERDLMELFQRVGDLERVETGIRFDLLNVGGWLSVETTDPVPPGGIPGIYLYDSGGAGVKLLAAAGGDLDLESSGGVATLAGASVAVTSAAGVDVAAGGLLAMTAGTGVTLDVTGDTAVTSLGRITLTAGTGGATSPNGVLELSAYDLVQILCSIGDTQVVLSNAVGVHSLVVSLVGGAQVFRIDNDGTIHGRTAIGAITWDLP